MPQRRDFIKLISWLGLQSLLPLFGFGKAFGNEPGASGSNDEFVSTSRGYRVPHNHTLRIPRTATENPPAAGLDVETSPANWLAWWGAIALRHRHRIHVTMSDLVKLKEGKPMSLQDEAGVHTFEFLPY